MGSEKPLIWHWEDGKVCMKNNTISYYNVKNRGVTVDAQLIKQYLCKSTEDMEFRYFIKNETGKNKAINQLMRESKERFSKDTKHAFCIDESMPKNLPAGDYCRMYIAQPFDYMFKDYMSDSQKNRNKDSFLGCSHIFTGIPIMDKLVKHNYNVDGCTILDHVDLPMTWDMKHSSRRDIYRKKLEFYFPAMQGKNILLILFAGEMEDEKGNNLFGRDDLIHFLDTLDDSWFVVINSWPMAQSLNYLPAGYQSRVGYAGSYLLDGYLLYVADLLITNIGKHAVNYAGLGKPVYCYTIKENGFCDYMKKFYPGLCVPYLKEYDASLFPTKGLSESGEIFYKEARSDSEKNPFDEICRLFST